MILKPQVSRTIHCIQTQGARNNQVQPRTNELKSSDVKTYCYTNVHKCPNELNQ